MRWPDVLDALFPPQCGGCDAAGTGLCERCLPFGRALGRTLPSLEVRALGSYEGPVRRAVLALKSGRRDVAGALAARLKSLIAPGDVVVPVPTTAARKRLRGFDGCELMARHACGERAAVLAQLRQRAGDSQRGRARRERLAAQGRFFWNGERLRGEEVVLLDDVVTTGSTLEDCAAALRSAGGIVRRAIAVAIV